MKDTVDLVLFKNEAIKAVYIWATRQAETKNVSVVNLFSKARYALSGKDNAQPTATTSIYRLALVTKQEDWVAMTIAENLEIDEVSDLRRLAIEDQEALGFKWYGSEREAYRIDNEYEKNKNKYRATKIRNLKYANIKNYAMSMLNDLLVDDENNQKANDVARFAISHKSDIENISQMLVHIFNKYVTII
jgi:hypothetical protein